MNRLPVVAAIPNYNMAEQLKVLLPSVVNSGYDEVLVLDDASIDGSHEVVEALGLGVRFISSPENKGAGAARNQVIGKLGHRSLIHFIDADTDLVTERMAEVAHEVMPDESVGFVGGLTTGMNGLQSVWNYGPRQSLWSAIGANVAARTEGLAVSDPVKYRNIRNFALELLADWPDPLSEPFRRQVFWNCEANLLIDSEVFEALGGFDTNLREHEIQDLAIRMSNLGLKRYFDPSMHVRHKAADVREYNRGLEMVKAEFYVARKHGIKNWFMPNGSFEPSLE